ncbi:hypothetical protein GS399_06740 [Pedobacter sp. HMF7647]|uniref:Tetratricopeptide repeat protein n=1 Tax=Hufsiella arboris TaxID=2695275 RepID=A0A7K1Y7V4_9SPHI|nr:hypothetical protein [Hufsiella arboris]MXV50665.1 hypothetical protein [Hufsiella arboris]
MNKTVKVFTVACLLLYATGASAQSPIKEAENAFAAYTKSKNSDDLSKAKKTMDAAYATRKDSFQYRNNLLRSMVYSTLANQDSLRKNTYSKDPIEETSYSLSKLTSTKLNDQHTSELNYVNKQLSNAYLGRANRRLANGEYSAALDDYLWVDSLSSGDKKVTHNLAVLSEKLQYYDRAAFYYQQLIKDKKRALPEYYISLADILIAENNEMEALKILDKGHTTFPKNKDILFKEINIYNNNRDFTPITTLIDDAINLEPDNLQLYYLAGFAFDSIGDKNVAETYYKKILSMDENNYAANYALGLLYLEQYLKNNNRPETLTDAGNYLKKASDINPNSSDTLKSLAMYYNLTGDKVQLEEINTKLNQIILN